MSKLKYNRAFIPVKHLKCPPVVELLTYADDENNLDYWINDSRESFHGEHDSRYFYFKDSRMPSHSKLPLSCLELEFSEEELTEKEL